MAPRNRRVDGRLTTNHAETGTNQHQEPFENFHAGYLRIDEDHLYRTGVRGAKKYILYCAVAFLVIVAFGNLVVTCALIGVLRISYVGVEAFEFIPHGELWRVFFDVDADTLTFSGNGKLCGRKNEDVLFDGFDALIDFSSKEINGSTVSVSSDGVNLITDELSFVNPITGKTMFSTNYANHPPSFKLPKYLQPNSLETPKLMSTVDGDLHLESSRYLYITGMEGVHVDGRQVLLQADGSVSLTSEIGHIEIKGHGGTTLNKIASMPRASNDPTILQVNTYKICICAGNGKIFMSPSTTGCTRANEAVNPCEV